MISSADPVAQPAQLKLVDVAVLVFSPLERFSFFLKSQGTWFFSSICGASGSANGQRCSQRWSPNQESPQEKVLNAASEKQPALQPRVPAPGS
jgi:hypothetical protein